MVIVPSNSLYIEALPGTHPLLEDFKLIHRAIDVKKAQADLRHAELENLRLASRLANAEYGDPDIDKVIVVGIGKM
jgi:HEPN domain-containing protein